MLLGKNYDSVVILLRRSQILLRRSPY